MISDRRKTLFFLLVLDTSRKQRGTQQQQEERDGRALAESILHVGVASEVEAAPVAG